MLVGYASIFAPFDGVITQRTLFQGDFVRAPTEGGSHIPLLTVQRTDLFRVVVQVPDRDVPFCKPGNPADMEIDALPGQKFSAKVSRIAQSEDPDTRLMHVEVDLPNPSGKICNGMYGQVTIYLEHSDDLAIPSSALVGKSQNGKGSVYVLRTGQTHRLPLTIGMDNGVQTAILSGLTEKDQVILQPPSDLVDGAPVRIVDR